MVNTRSGQVPVSGQSLPQPAAGVDIELPEQVQRATARGRPRSQSRPRDPSFRRLERDDGIPIGRSRPASSLNLSQLSLNELAISSSTFGAKRKCVNYDGKKPSLHVTAWINAFEIIFYDELDAEKKYIIVQYLDGDALTWYSNHIIPKIGKLNYSDIKSSFLDRFKHHEVRPIIAAQELQLTRAHTIQSYFEEKMRLLEETTLPDLDKVAILNRGMPYSYKPHLITSKIDTPNQWLGIALELESSFKTSKFANSSPFKPKTFAAAATAENKRPYQSRPQANDQRKPSNNKPTSPCRFCENRGEKKFHWHSDCHHNPKNKVPQQSQTQVKESANTADSAQSFHSGN